MVMEPIEALGLQLPIVRLQLIWAWPIKMEMVFSPNDGDCDDTDENLTTTFTDADCDGIVTADDCDDNDNAVGSSVNGQSMKSYYTDSDSDGFGDSAASAEMTCVPPTGKVDNNSDCNDGDANTYPGAGYSKAEVCPLLV